MAEHKLKHNVNQKAKLEEAEAQVNGEITPAELERAAADRHRRFNHLERDFSPEIKRLVWGDSNDYATILELEPDGFDVIIGADVVYYDVGEASSAAQPTVGVLSSRTNTRLSRFRNIVGHSVNFAEGFSEGCFHDGV